MEPSSTGPQKKRNPWKVALIVLLCLLLLAAAFIVWVLWPSGKPTPEAASTGAETLAPANAQTPDGDGWTIMFYLCGTDLESDSGMASQNLEECLASTLPENVRLLVCTGGTESWDLDYINSDYIEYHRLADGNGHTLLEQLPSASMGDPATLGNFIRYGVEHYPASHYGTIIWNHGAGMNGVAFDELYDGDCLSIAELSEAFSYAGGTQMELIGFDACLMATVENAIALSPYGSYMVASEESEPGEGWDYAAMLGAISEDPDIDGEALGRIICDSYYEKCGEESNFCTLSVTDLSKVNELGRAFDDMAAEMTGLTGDVDLFRTLTRDIEKAENYGGNTDEEGYYNLVDIGDMVLNAKEVLSNTGDAVLDALFDAVVYNVNGSARKNANGLATFYPLKSDEGELDQYAATAAYSRNYLTYLQASRRSWSAPEDFSGQDFDNTVAEMPEHSIASGDYDVSVSTFIDDEGFFNLSIDGGSEYVTDVCFTLYQLDYEYGEYMFLGRDNDLYMNDDGTLYGDNFRGVWPALEGIFVDLDLISTTDEYFLYSIPILLNDEEAFLRARYSFDAGRYELLGVVAGNGDNEFASRGMRQLTRGDTVTVLMTGTNWDTGEENIYDVGSFTVDGAPVLEEAVLTDGDYLYQYEITDMLGNVYYSDQAVMECSYGEIYVYNA